MLLDEVELTVKGGHGGPGKVSFYPGFKAGPDGGNGGRGGDLYAVVTSDLTALNRYSHKKDFSAENGQPGDKNRKSGKDGVDLELTFPLGTSLMDEKSGEEIELNEVNQRILLCKGGLGGRGNFEFKSSRRTTPTYAQPGLEGETRKFKVILKLIADFGLIGLPNAGKSSLLNELTASHAKTADYQFTTLEPNLGVCDERIIADIPGLIEGASAGKGLGFKFLRHIEKVRTLIHCISSDSGDPTSDYRIVRKELDEFDKRSLKGNFQDELIRFPFEKLLEKEEIIIITKADLVTPEKLNETRRLLKKFKKKILTTSIHDLDSLEGLKKELSVKG